MFEYVKLVLIKLRQQLRTLISSLGALDYWPGLGQEFFRRRRRRRRRPPKK